MICLKLILLDVYTILPDFKFEKKTSNRVCCCKFELKDIN